MDLSNLKPKSDTVEVLLKHPGNGEQLMTPKGVEMSVTVHAPHSKEYKKALYEQQNARLKKVQSGKSDALDAADLAEARLRLLAEVTASWEITLDGKCPKLTKETAYKIYEDIFWIPSQIEEALDNYLDFPEG